MPGEFTLMANAHALEEGCLPIVEEMLGQSALFDRELCMCPTIRCHNLEGMLAYGKRPEICTIARGDRLPINCPR
jgi:hypothetical protein